MSYANRKHVGKTELKYHALHVKNKSFHPNLSTAALEGLCYASNLASFSEGVFAVSRVLDLVGPMEHQAAQAVLVRQRGSACLRSVLVGDHEKPPLCVDGVPVAVSIANVDGNPVLPVFDPLQTERGLADRCGLGPDDVWLTNTSRVSLDSMYENKHLLEITGAEFQEVMVSLVDNLYRIPFMARDPQPFRQEQLLAL